MPECSIQTTETNSVKEQYREHINHENNVSTDKINRKNSNDYAIYRETQKRERLCRAIARRTRVRQEEYVPPHWGVVAEPYMCSWHALNLMMHHLHVPLISEAELTNAVEEVNAFLDKLTQPSQSMRQASQMEFSSTKRHSKMHSRNYKESQVDHTNSITSFTPNRKHNNTQYSSKNNDNNNNILVSSQSFPSMMEYMSQSSQSMTQPHILRRPAVLMTDLQDALLLEVLKILCTRRSNYTTSYDDNEKIGTHSMESRRKLTFTRIGRREWRARNGRLSTIDLIPHKKCFVVADRSDPSMFVIFLALPRPQPHPQELQSFCATQKWLMSSHSSSLKSSEEEQQQSEQEKEEFSVHGTKESNLEFAKNKINCIIKACSHKKSNTSHLSIHTHNSTKRKAIKATTAAARTNTAVEENNHYVQIIAVSNTPVPWRRLVRKRLPYISLRDCAIAVIERIDDNNDVIFDNDNTDNKINNFRLHKQKLKQSTSNVHFSQSQEMPLIEDVQNTNKYGKHKILTNSFTTSYSNTIPQYSVSNFNFFAHEPLFSASLEVTHDPLRLLPTVELGNLTQRRGRRGVRRSWVERLFLSNTSDRAAALRKLYSYNNVEDIDTDTHSSNNRSRTESNTMMRNDFYHINNNENDDIEYDDEYDYPF